MGLLPYLPDNHDVYWLGHYIPSEDSYKIGNFNGSPNGDSYLLGKAWHQKPISGRSFSFDGLIRGYWVLSFNVDIAWDTGNHGWSRSYSRGALVANGSVTVYPLNNTITSSSHWYRSGYGYDGSGDYHSFFDQAYNLTSWTCGVGGCNDRTYHSSTVSIYFNTSSVWITEVSGGNTGDGVYDRRNYGFSGMAYFIKTS